MPRTVTLLICAGCLVYGAENIGQYALGDTNPPVRRLVELGEDLSTNILPPGTELEGMILPLLDEVQKRIPGEETATMRQDVERMAAATMDGRYAAEVTRLGEQLRDLGKRYLRHSANLYTGIVLLLTALGSGAYGFRREKRE